MSSGNRSDVLNGASGVTGKKKPIILTSTKTVTTTKTTRHVCLGENGEDIVLNELQSFLEEEPTERAVKKKIVPRNSELCKPKKKSKKASRKLNAQHWTESDTDENATITTTDCEDRRQELLSSNDKESREICSSLINKNADQAKDEFRKDNSSLVEHANESKVRKIAKKQSRRDINDIMEEVLLSPIIPCVAHAENHLTIKATTTPRKLSAIFETSAEVNATKCTSSPPVLDKSPFTDKGTSNHYNNTVPSNNSPSRRTTRQMRANDVDETDINFMKSVSTQSQRKTRSNKKLADKSLPLEKNGDIVVHKKEIACDLSPVGKVYKSKARTNSKNSRVNNISISKNQGNVIISTALNGFVSSRPLRDAPKRKVMENSKKKTTYVQSSDEKKPSVKLAEERPVNYDSSGRDAVADSQSSGIETIALPKTSVAKKTKQSTWEITRSTRTKSDRPSTKPIKIFDSNSNAKKMYKVEGEAKNSSLTLKSSDKIGTKLIARKSEEHLDQTPVNESLLFETSTSESHVDAEQEGAKMDQIALKRSNKRLIIYSPSRDKLLVERIDDNRVIIPKLMIAKAIGNPQSGVLKSMSDNGMIIDANERLMYSPREGEEINVKKEVKKGVDILEVLAKRRQSVFILQCQNR